MTLPDLARLVAEAAPAELAALAGKLREAELLAEMRLRAAPTSATATEAPEPGRLLTPEEALGLMGGALSRKWLLRHTKGRSFRRDHGRKVVRFEESGLRRWWSAKRT